MRVDIYYDPVRPYTFVRIDGKAVSRSDIYGFLYPVREYTLQAWLYPSGSWRGLKSEMMDLTREEPSQVVFHGRQVDYLDFEGALDGLANCACSFEFVDYIRISAGYLAEAEKRYDVIVNTPVVTERDDSDITRTFAELFPEQDAWLKQLAQEQDAAWLSKIDDRAGLSRCLNGDGCCLIDGDRMLSYDNYSLIGALMAGLKRAPDMLVCAFASDEKKREFVNFNAQYKDHAVTFIRTDETAWKEALRAKYGTPYEYRMRLTRLRRCCEALDACFEVDYGADASADASAPATPGQVRATVRQKLRKRWATHQKNHLNALHSLIYGIDYIAKGEGTDG